mmetsp:Transcript_82560/g.157258  ORF Transcript_82560/g.157258 Transcript_82560/m.157258 type:complete len:225 (-) Transcript_82560:727-1401(-)
MALSHSEDAARRCVCKPRGAIGPEAWAGSVWLSKCRCTHRCSSHYSRGTWHCSWDECVWQCLHVTLGGAGDFLATGFAGDPRFFWNRNTCWVQLYFTEWRSPNSCIGAFPLPRSIPHRADARPDGCRRQMLGASICKLWKVLGSILLRTLWARALHLSRWCMQCIRPWFLHAEADPCNLSSIHSGYSCGSVCSKITLSCHEQVCDAKHHAKLHASGLVGVSLWR